MTCFRWHETVAVLPPAEQVVLGWWDQFNIKAVMRLSETKWCDALLIAYHVPPLYWSNLPSPIEPQNEDVAA